MNAKFLRNGIVMLVLVAGTVALLYTWVSSSSTPQASRAYSDFSNDVKADKVQTVVQDGETLTVTTEGDGTTYTVIVPNPITGDVFARHAEGRGRGRATRLPAPTSTREKADGRHVVDRPAADRAAAAPRDRRLHLLHDAPGPGDE